MKPFIRSAYNYDTRAASRLARKTELGEGRADQSFRDESDINILVRRFGVTPLVSGAPLPPTPQDFDAEVFDFQTSMNLLRAAEESFAAMSAETRYRFNNDPHRFVNFCSATEPDGTLTNLEEMRKMGLAVPKAPDILPPAPVRVEVVNPSPPVSTPPK